MINFSKRFRQALYENDRTYVIKAAISLASGATFNLTNDQIWTGGVSFDDAVSDDETFDAIGSTVINTATIVLNNRDDSFSDCDFTNAKVIVSVGKTFGVNDSEIEQKGVYLVDEATYRGDLITLEMVDLMSEFEKPYTTSLNYSGGKTLRAILEDACSKCGVPAGLSITSLNQNMVFHNHAYTVMKKPASDTLTYREVIGWCAQIAGCYARVSRLGKLELEWFDQATLESRKSDYDGGKFNPWNLGDVLDGNTKTGTSEDDVFAKNFIGPAADMGNFTEEKPLHYLSGAYSENISVDDVVITRIKVICKERTSDNEEIEKTYLAGEEGYTIEIRDNEFITPDRAQSVADDLASRLIGLTFRKATVVHLSDPSIEAGDVAIAWDRRGRDYPILVTRTEFVPYGRQTTISAAENPKRNSAARVSVRTKAYADARKLVENEKTDFDASLDALQSALDAKEGLYSTVESDGSGGSIYYLHDKPNLEESTVVWKMTKEAIGVSTDGGKHYNGGMTVDGEVVANLIAAHGINADWINTGSLSITAKKGTSSAYELFYGNVASGALRIHAKDTSGNTTFKLNSSTGELTIAAAKTTVGNQSLENYVKSLDHVMTKTEIFNKLTDNGARKGIYMTNGELYINGTYVKTGTITSTNGNTSWNLDDGTFTMRKGSISIGSKFSVDSTGKLTCAGADISGTLSAADIKTGWNSISGHVDIDGDAINIYESSGHSSTQKIVSLMSQGIRIYKTGDFLGGIGHFYMSQAGITQKRCGIGINLSGASNFFAITARSSDSGEYAPKLLYVNQWFGNYKTKGFYINSTVDFMNNSIYDARLIQPTVVNSDNNVPRESFGSKLSVLIPTQIASDGTVDTWVRRSLEGGMLF